MSEIFQNLFSKIIAFILAVIASLSGTLTEAPEMKVVNNVNSTTSLIQVEITNYTSDDYTVLSDFTMEKKVENEWVEVEFSPFYKFSNVAYIISSRQKVTLSIDVINAFADTLSEGEYRISKVLMPNEEYTKALDDIAKFVPDKNLDDEAKEAARAAFEAETMAKVPKVVCTAEFTVVAAPRV